MCKDTEMDALFSQRMGITKPKSVIQVDSIDDDLRNALWNALTVSAFDEAAWFLPRENTRPNSRYYKYVGWKFEEYVWVDFLKRTVDTIPSTFDDFKPEIRRIFFKFEWYQVYDFLEFIANIIDSKSTTDTFIDECNKALKKELSGFIFIDKRLCPNTSSVEIKEIEQALISSRNFTQHLDKALELLANRKSPDYSNSIKEAISAVEALCQLITENKKATLGDALKKLEIKIGDLHPALKGAFNSLYGYTSDAEGIRHGLIGTSSLDIEDAKFMLVACSAFVNYLVAKSAKAGIKLAYGK